MATETKRTFETFADFQRLHPQEYATATDGLTAVQRQALEDKYAYRQMFINAEAANYADRVQRAIHYYVETYGPYYDLLMRNLDEMQAGAIEDADDETRTLYATPGGIVQQNPAHAVSRESVHREGGSSGDVSRMILLQNERRQLLDDFVGKFADCFLGVVRNE